MAEDFTDTTSKLETTAATVEALARALELHDYRRGRFGETSAHTARVTQLALRLAEAFRARVIDATNESFVFEITGTSTKITQFIDLMRPLGLVEVARTGVAAIGRGAEGM